MERRTIGPPFHPGGDGLTGGHIPFVRSNRWRCNVLFENILFPVDFSPACDQIAPAVNAMRLSLATRLSLLHSIELPQPWMSEDAANDWLDVEALRGRAHERLRLFANTHFSCVDPKLEVQTGNAADAICRYARQQRIDLIMIPTHGYGIFRRALIGSVTTKVLHDADCAVWTSAHSETIRTRPCRKILCGVGNLERADVLKTSAMLADAFAASLTIVHAYPYFAETPSQRYERDIPRRDREHILQKIDHLQHLAGTHAPVVLACGEVNEVISEAARRCDADLVSVGRRSFGHFLGSLQSHLYYIIRSTDCPVIALPGAPSGTHEEFTTDEAAGAKLHGARAG